jgi:hypothetical protein
MKSEEPLEADIPEAGGSAIPDALSPSAQDNQLQLPEISIDDDMKSESEANSKIDETLEAASIKSNENVRMTRRVVEEMNEVQQNLLDQQRVKTTENVDVAIRFAQRVIEDVNNMGV